MTGDAKLLGVGELQGGVETPQKITPPTKPPSVKKARLSVAAGVVRIFHTQSRRRFIPAMAYSLPACLTPISLMSRKVLPTSGRTSACGTWQAVQK